MNKFGFTKLKIFLTILLATSVCKKSFCEESIFQYNLEKVLLVSVNFLYQSQTLETIQKRNLLSYLQVGYYFNKNFSLFLNLPCSINLLKVKDPSESMYGNYANFLIEPISINPVYKTEIFEQTFKFSLRIDLPSRKKLSENLENPNTNLILNYNSLYSDSQIENYNNLSITPGIILEKIIDPIIYNIICTWTIPLWNKDNTTVYKNWNTQIINSLNFIINDKFSISCEFGLNLSSISDNYILDTYLFNLKLGYALTPSEEIRIGLINYYEDISWKIGISLSYLILTELFSNKEEMEKMNEKNNPIYSH